MNKSSCVSTDRPSAVAVAISVFAFIMLVLPHTASAQSANSERANGPTHTLVSCNDYRLPHSISFGRYTTVEVYEELNTSNLRAEVVTGPSTNYRVTDKAFYNVGEASAHQAPDVFLRYVGQEEDFNKFELTVYRDGTADASGLYQNGKTFQLERLNCKVSL